MSTSQRLVLCLVVLGAAVFVTRYWPHFERPDVDAAGEASRKSQAPIEEPSIDASLARIDPVDAVAPSRAPADFTGGGTIRLLGHDGPDRAVELAWVGRNAGEQIAVASTHSTWSARFPVDHYELARALVNGTEWQVAHASAISAGSATCDVVLAPDWGRVVDVYDSMSVERRLSEVNVELNPIEVAPQSAPVKIARTRTADGRVQLVTSTQDEHGREISTWRLERASNPVLLPEQAVGATLSVGARGYRKQLVKMPPGPGVTKVYLTPGRALIVELQGAAPTSTLTLRLTEFGADPLSRGPDASNSSQHRFEDVRSDRVRVEISAVADDGQRVLLAQRDVVMASLGDTHEIVELPDALPPAALSTVSVELVAAGAGATLAGAKFGLLPIDGASGELLAYAQTLWRPLSQFESGSVEGRFVAKLGEVRQGVYLAVVAPLGVARRVEVGPGDFNTIVLEVAPQAKLIVWPTRASGGRAQTAEELGSLFWMPIPDSTEQAAREKAPERRSIPSVRGEDIALGLAIAAKFANGAWEVTAPVGTRVVLSFMGPRALGVEPLEFVMAPGVQETALEFKNL